MVDAPASDLRVAFQDVRNAARDLYDMAEALDLIARATFDGQGKATVFEALTPRLAMLADGLCSDVERLEREQRRAGLVA